MKKRLSMVLCLALLWACILPAAGETAQCNVNLRKWIHNETYRSYVQQMLNFQLRTNKTVKDALDGGFCAVFLFDGASDNMDDPVLSDLSYYRVSGVCIVLRKGADGEVKLVYFNDNASTIPDRPLEFGAWELPETGEVGPATILDGTYQLYSVYHKGKYEALHVRSSYSDDTIPAIYMTPEGYVPYRADAINIHTRTSNHTSGTEYMWSAGCPLIGGGASWEFWKLMESTYHQNYDSFETDSFVGTLTIDRQLLRTEMYTLYRNPDAVDAMLTNSWDSRYLSQCGRQDYYPQGKPVQVLRQTRLMSLPCSAESDGHSRELAVLEPGQTLQIYGSLFNTRGNLWYEANRDGQRCYLYAGHVKPLEPEKAPSWWEKLFGK